MVHESGGWLDSRLQTSQNPASLCCLISLLSLQRVWTTQSTGKSQSLWSSTTSAISLPGMNRICSVCNAGLATGRNDGERSSKRCDRLPDDRSKLRLALRAAGSRGERTVMANQPGILPRAYCKMCLRRATREQLKGPRNSEEPREPRQVRCGMLKPLSFQ